MHFLLWCRTSISPILSTSCLLQVVVSETQKKGGTLTIFKSVLLTKYLFAVILAWWVTLDTTVNIIPVQVYWLFSSFFFRFSLNLTYYCLSFNVGNLGLDIFLTQLIFGVSELPAHVLCIWLLEALGRRVCLISTLLAAGLTCILILAVGQGKPHTFVPCSTLQGILWPL